MRGPHRHLLSRPRLLLLIALAALAPAPPARGTPRVDVVLTGLDVPWALAWAPDGRLFFTERRGRIRVAEGRPPMTARTLVELAVHVSAESGLMGLALDPDFARTGHLYVCYTTVKGDTPVNRVVRLPAGGDVRDTRVLLDDMPAAAIHDGCRLKFGPDRTLYVTMGDAGQADAAQRRESLSGKILRINADGSIPADNPFRGSPVLSLGHRNPQGLAWDGRGRLWASEHGSSAHDEINLIRPGGNYGWPLVRGRETRDGLVPPALESGDDTWAPSGMAFLGDSLYVAGLRGQRLLRVTLDAGGRVTGATALLPGAYGRLRDVVVGPDGALYVATNNRDGRGVPRPEDDRVLRVVP
jgi:glucose/arabinose dehydrogenase